MVRGLTATAANHYFTLVHDLPSSNHRSGSLQDSTGFLLLDAVLCNIFLSLLINLAPIQYMYLRRALPSDNYVTMATTLHLTIVSP